MRLYGISTTARGCSPRTRTRRSGTPSGRGSGRSAGTAGSVNGATSPIPRRCSRTGCASATTRTSPRTPHVTGELTTGADCTLNPFTTVRGTVVLGDGVRIGAHTSLLGFNHSTKPACNVLDVAHPLWLCGRQLGAGSGGDGYRTAEIRAWAERQLAAACPAGTTAGGSASDPRAPAPSRAFKAPRCGSPSSGISPTCWAAPTTSATGHAASTARAGTHRPRPARLAPPTACSRRPVACYLLPVATGAAMAAPPRRSRRSRRGAGRR